MIQLFIQFEINNCANIININVITCTVIFLYANLTNNEKLSYVIVTLCSFSDPFFTLHNLLLRR